MAVSAQRITVSSTAIALNTASTSGQKLVIKNLDPTNGADLGPTGVTAGAGFSLANGASVTVELQPQEVLFAIRSAGADVVLSVLRT